MTLQLPEFLRDPFSSAMSQSVLLPAFVALFGIVAALFLIGSLPSGNNRDAPRDEDIADDDYDDDDYVEFILVREPDTGPPPGERLPRPRPAPGRRDGPVGSRRSLVDRPAPQSQPIGFAHNGSHVGSGRRLRPITEPPTRPPRPGAPGDRPPQRHHNGSARPHLGAEGEAPRGQQYRPGPDEDPTGYGRHSSGK